MNLPVWNARGLIFGPEESEENFYKRCLSAPSRSQDAISPLAKNLFDINPDWIQITYSNKGLHFWEGGCTLIEENKVTLQLPKSLEQKTKFFRIYTKEELLAHELVHVVRHTFEEPIFEEVLAYQTSSSKFRRFFGPFFRTSKESTLLIFLFVLAFLMSIFTPFYKIAFIGFFAFFGIGLFRLLRTQYIFAKTRKKLAKLIGMEKALFVMVRLNDREIMRFSKMKEEEIVSYCEKMRKIHFRWQQIYNSYFSKPS